MTKNQVREAPQRPDLSTLALRELQALYAEVLGEPTRCPNRVFLERKIRARWEEEDAVVVAQESATVEQVGFFDHEGATVREADCCGQGGRRVASKQSAWAVLIDDR